MRKKRLKSDNIVNNKYIAEIKEFINCPELKEKNRKSRKDFSRNRIFTFIRLIGVLLCVPRRSNTKRVNMSFNKIFEDPDKDLPSASALLQARKKLKPEVFLDLLNYSNKLFYENKDNYYNIKKWKGHPLVAVDGSRINIPDTKNNNKLFTRQRSKYDKRGVLQGTLLCSYDPLNNLPLYLTLEKIGGEIGPFIEKHLPFFKEGVMSEYFENGIWIFDRLYVGYNLLSALVGNNMRFCIRCKTSGGFKVKEKFVRSKKTDSIVTFKCPPNQKKFVTSNNYSEVLKLRLVKVILSSGETEVLVTNLMDKEKYPRECFKELYFHRWPVEEGFGILKTYMGIEYFTSYKLQLVLQDIYAHFFLYGYCEMLKMKEDEYIYSKCKKRGRKHEYQVSITNIITEVYDNIIELTVLPNIDIETLYKKIARAIRNDPPPIRPNRHNERIKKTDSGRLVFKTVWKKQYS